MSCTYSTLLFSRDFTKQQFLIPKDFVYFQVPGVYVADDGETTQNNSGLTIESIPFTKRASGIFDHPKYLVLTNRQFYLPNNGIELFIQTKLRYKSTGLTDPNTSNGIAPGIQKYADTIQNIRDEPRVSSAVLKAIDASTGIGFYFVLGDSTVYAIYEHLPVTDDTAVFTYAIPIYTRTNVDEFVDLKMSFRKTNKNTIVTWYVNGVKRFSVSDIGLPLVNQEWLVKNGGGEFKHVDINHLEFGFGNFTLLDYFPFSKSYLQVGQSLTSFDDGYTFKNVQPLTNLQSLYYQRMKNQLNENVLQEDFTYEGTREVDGNGAITKLLNFNVGIASHCQLSNKVIKYIVDKGTKIPFVQLTKEWKIEIIPDTKEEKRFNKKLFTALL